jgi:hypothetical protein
MLIDDILTSNAHPDSRPLCDVINHCRQFIEESQGFPLFKNLPTTFDDLHRVKVRKQKKKTQITETFNKAFDDKFNDLRQRALFVYASEDSLPLIEGQEAFYVFPVNGYSYMYNSQVDNSNDEYKNAFDVMLEQFNSNEDALQILSDLLQYTYTSENLVEGLKQGSEIIMYNVPFYYAIRPEIVENYSELLTSLQD